MDRTTDHARRVVVTGGSGKLGRACVADLLEHGYEVVNVDVAPPPADQGCAYVRADLTDLGETVAVLTAVDDRYRGVDAVVHLAAIPAPGGFPDHVIFETNTVSTYNVFSAARTAGIRTVVWASSETVLGLPFETPPPYLPVDEEYPGRPESSYSLSKLLGEHTAEQMCRQDPSLMIHALRFSNVMEPHDYAAFPAFDADPSLRRWNAWGYIDARDGAQAVRRSLEHGRPGFEVFVVANADTVMSRSSTELAAAEFPGVPLRAGLGTHETLLSIDKARRVLGFEPQHSWRDQV